MATSTEETTAPAHGSDEGAEHGDGAGPGLSFLGGMVLGISGVIGLTLVVMMAWAPGPNRDVDSIIPFVGSLTVLEEGAAVDAEVSVRGFEFGYDPDEIRTAGRLELTLINEGQILHNIEFVNIPNFDLEAQAGQSATARVSMSSGKYIMFCSIPGHREAGMEASFEVE